MTFFNDSLILFFSRTSKFRHSLTNSFRFWTPRLPYRVFPLDSTGLLPSSRTPSHIVNMPVNMVVSYCIHHAVVPHPDRCQPVDDPCYPTAISTVSAEPLVNTGVPAVLKFYLLVCSALRQVQLMMTPFGLVLSSSLQLLVADLLVLLLHE